MLCGWKFRSSQKGGAKVGKTKKGKGTKWMVLVDGKGLPLGVSLESASPAEVRLAEKLNPETQGKPERIIADRAYDSNRFRTFLAHQKIEPIIPARPNNTRATHQDGRRLRRSRRRWIVERTFSWFGWCPRLVVRWERCIEMYQAFFLLACSMITLERVLK
jgi:transposase